MTNEANIKALMDAAFVTESAAKAIIARMEAKGFTVYKKKIARNERRPVHSQRMTAKLAEAIRGYYERNPEATQQQIANVFNINIGRVNEALIGGR